MTRAEEFRRYALDLGCAVLEWIHASGPHSPHTVQSLRFVLVLEREDGSIEATGTVPIERTVEVLGKARGLIASRLSEVQKERARA